MLIELIQFATGLTLLKAYFRVFIKILAQSPLHRTKAKYPLYLGPSKELLDSPLKCETNEKNANQATKSCDLRVSEDSKTKSHRPCTFLNMNDSQ